PGIFPPSRPGSRAWSRPNDSSADPLFTVAPPPPPSPESPFGRNQSAVRVVKIKRMTRFVPPAAAIVLLLARPALPAQVDISACRGMYDVLEAMRSGASRETVSARLDALLQTRPYQVMFRHYNRSWRPNHLPPDVFKRMILSLQFPDAYHAGENERADTMRTRWTKFYPDLAAYESQLRQLSSAYLPRLIADGVRYAQGW